MACCGQTNLEANIIKLYIIGLVLSWTFGSITFLCVLSFVLQLIYNKPWPYLGGFHFLFYYIIPGVWGFGIYVIGILLEIINGPILPLISGGLFIYGKKENMSSLILIGIVTEIIHSTGILIYVLVYVAYLITGRRAFTFYVNKS